MCLLIASNFEERCYSSVGEWKTEKYFSTWCGAVKSKAPPPTPAKKIPTQSYEGGFVSLRVELSPLPTTGCAIGAAGRIVQRVNLRVSRKCEYSFVRREIANFPRVAFRYLKPYTNPNSLPGRWPGHIGTVQWQRPFDSSLISVQPKSCPGGVRERTRGPWNEIRIWLTNRTLEWIIQDVHINNKVQSLFRVFFGLIFIGFTGWLATIIGALIVRVIVYFFPWRRKPRRRPRCVGLQFCTRSLTLICSPTTQAAVLSKPNSLVCNSYVIGPVPQLCHRSALTYDILSYVNKEIHKLIHRVMHRVIA